MESREQIQNIDQLNEAFNLCIQIQNEGIATVFVKLSGHIEQMEVSLHVPKWISGSIPDYQDCLCARGEEYTESNAGVISKLKEILEKGKQGDDGLLIQSKEKEIRRNQYEVLKAEFETTEQ